MTTDSASGSDDDVTFRDTYDWSSIPPSTAVVDALETVVDREETTFGPLYDVVEPDALNAILRGGGGHGSDGRITVSFEFGEYAVTASDDGEVTVARTPPDQRDDGQ